MTPIELKLTNFIGIKSGLGLDVIEIKIAELTKDARVIALQGENGKGKTTILDNLHPYRLMPSRAGSYSPGSFSYYDHTYGDAEKHLLWMHDKKLYRSVIKIRGSNKTKKTEAYLHVMTDSWEPCATGEGDAVSDGKTVTYDRAVNLVLGSPEMFFTSAFSSQGKKPLSGYTNGDIKSLMSELLGLEHIICLGEKAGDVVKGLVSHVNGFNQALTLVGENHEKLNVLKMKHGQLSAELGLMSTGQSQARIAVETLTENLIKIRSASQDDAALADQRRSLMNKLKEVTDTGDKRIAEIGHDLTRLQSEQSQNASYHTAEVKSIRDRLIRFREDLTANQGILDSGESIIAAVNRAASLDQMATSNNELVDDAEEKLATRDKYQTAMEVLNNELTATNAQAGTIESHLKNLQNQAGLVDRVPCSRTEYANTCELLSAARDANQIIEIKQDELDQIHIHHSEIKERILKGVEVLAEFEGVGSYLTSLLGARSKINTEIADNKLLADKAPKLEIAVAAIESLNKQSDDLAVQMEETNKRFSSKDKEFNDLIVEKSESFKVAEVKRETDAIDIQEQMNDLPAPGDGNVLQDAQDKLKAAEVKLAGADARIGELNTDLAGTDALIGTLDESIKKAETIKKKIDLINIEIAGWKLLTKALGKDGIIALSIDDAGPTISSLANDLLLSCYGPRFTVSIDTQSQTAAGTMKETFDIIVFDGERDEKKSIKTMSGGERVWINECITRAIALYQAQQSGQTYGSLFTDETDGALDPERKAMFMKMKRTVLELGGYEKEFFITHTPELLDMADVIIDLGSYEQS